MLVAQNSLGSVCPVPLTVRGTRDVSDAFPGRPKTSKQCRARWVASLDPKITTRPWTEAEERIIRESQAEVGNKWATIAKR